MPLPSQLDSSYSRSVEIAKSAGVIFLALTNDLQAWWGKMDHPVDAVGDVFKVSWGEPWYQFKVVRYEPGIRIDWRCIDANQIIS